MAETLSISVDSADCTALLGEIETLLRDSPDWLRWLASEALESFDEHVELLPVDGDLLPAPATGDLRVVAKPAHKLVLLAAALRAGNGQGSGLIDFPAGHGGPHE